MTQLMLHQMQQLGNLKATYNYGTEGVKDGEVYVEELVLEWCWSFFKNSSTTVHNSTRNIPTGTFQMEVITLTITGA